MKTLARQHDKAELLQRLRELRPETAGRWGRMSAHQMVCHLRDSLLMATGAKPVTHSTGTLQRTIIRTMVKWVVLYVPMRWPAGISTRPEIDQQIGGTRPVAFAADIAQLEELLELFTSPTRSFAWALHPVFGRMSEASWLRWAYLHIDHHLRQFGA
jgi:hypothetical protein